MAANRVCYGLRDCGFALRKGSIVLLTIGSAESPKEGPVVAMSAACTHMGCIVQWQNSDKKFHCPCHGGLFTEYGQPENSSPVRYLTQLPRLDTKIEDGNVFVRVPGTPASKK